MYKKWRYQEVDSSLVEEISSKNNISELLATVLINRGIKTKKDLPTIPNVASIANIVNLYVFNVDYSQG